jgi:threonine dehydrogenase-like Zn-dependent dehydrogenase
MKTILADGEGGVFMAELPTPVLFEKSVLCRMTHSLISAGTERMMINNARGRTKEDIITSGHRIGYTGAGIVEQVLGQDLPFSPGQRVAFYGGPYVGHSELVAVPRNLVYAIPDSLSSAHASFGGLSTIAMHGFRKGRAALGDVVFVGGAGVLGNLLAQQALLSGCRVVVSEPDAERRDRMARSVPPQSDLLCVTPEEVEAAIKELTNGRGADVVYPCMSTTAPDVMAQAVRSARPGGRVVIVGVFDINIPREDFVLREVEVTFSRAGGPGRYDPNYERGGVDYPLQYARWTEGRNLEESLRLIASGKLNVCELLGHEYPVQDFQKAYEAVLQSRSDLGHLLIW